MIKKFYLKLLMSLMLVALAVPQVMAEPLTVADGSATSEYVPIYGYYYDTGFKNTMVYPADLLSEMAGGTINSITFYANSDYTALSGGTVKVSLKEVDETTVNGHFSDLTQVFSGTPTKDGNKCVITFDTPFEYQGGNLAVEIHLTSTGSNWPTIYFLGVNQTGASYNSYGGTLANSYVRDFLPKATFDYDSGVLEDYSAKVTPTEIAFGKLAVDGTKTVNVTLKNNGLNAFSYSLSGLVAPFSTTATNGSLESQASVEIPVKFNPTTEGDFTGTLTINCGEAGSYTVALTGSAANEITVCEASTEMGTLPVYGTQHDNDQTNQLLYPAEKLTGMIGKTITSMTFYPSAGISFYNGSVTFALANMPAGTSTYPTYRPELLTPAEYTTVGTIDMPSSRQDNVTEWGLSFTTPFVYNGGDLLIIVTTEHGNWGSTNFKAESQGSVYRGIYSYGSTKSSVSYLPMVTFGFGESTPTPVITVDPATVDAFSTEVGTPVSKTVTVTGENLTDAITATVSGTNASYFTAALIGSELTITYNPTEAGENHTATLTLSSTGAEPVVINLTGTATAAAQPYAVTVNPENGYDFGNVLVDNTKVWTLTVTNNGTESVTPTLTGLVAPFSTTYTAAPLAAGESVSIAITFAPTAVEDYTNAITLSFPETTIDDYTFELTGKGVNEYAPTADNEVVRLITVDKRSIYEPNFIDEANGNTTPQQLNCYDMRFKMAQLEDPDKQIKAGDLHPGNNLYEFYAIDDFGTEFRFATINLFAEGQPSSNPSVSAMDAPIKVTPSVEYYTEDGMPVHSSHTHNTTLNYTEKIYNNVNDLVDLEGVIDYVNDTWSANTATNAHPDHYKFQIRGVGQYGDMLTELTAEYVESHMIGYGGQLVYPEGWEGGSYTGANNEIDGVHTFYYYDLYIKKSFFDERGITGPVTVVVNTTLSGSGFNADNYKAMSVNGVEQIIAKEEFKDYSWTVPLLNELPTNTVVEQVPMGVIIRLVSTGADFNRTRGIYIYGGGTGVSNVDTVGIYKSSMNVKAYTQKQVDEDTNRGLVAMNAGAQEDVNVLAYGDPAVTGYDLFMNTSASTSGMTKVSTATHETDGSYTVSSQTESSYNGNYKYLRDESLGNIDGMWLNMYKAYANTYYLPVTVANGVGDDGVVRSNGNTYGSAMQQVEDNGSVKFTSNKCERSQYTWVKDGVTYSYYSPEVVLNGELPADGYELYNYRFWVDYDEDAPAWDFEIVDGKTHLTTLMDRPLAEGATPHLGGQIPQGGKENWVFVAPADLDEVKLVARFYYKKTSTGKARPTDKDRLYYVVENQVTVPVGVITGIDNVSSKAVASVKYYNMMGIESDVPFEGVNIEVITFTDGSRSSRKIMK